MTTTGTTSASTTGTTTGTTSMSTTGTTTPLRRGQAFDQFDLVFEGAFIDNDTPLEFDAADLIFASITVGSAATCAKFCLGSASCHGMQITQTGSTFMCALYSGVGPEEGKATTAMSLSYIRDDKDFTTPTTTGTTTDQTTFSTTGTTTASTTPIPGAPVLPEFTLVFEGSVSSNSGPSLEFTSRSTAVIVTQNIPAEPCARLCLQVDDIVSLPTCVAIIVTEDSQSNTFTCTLLSALGSSTGAATDKASRSFSRIVSCAVRGFPNCTPGI